MKDTRPNVSKLIGSKTIEKIGFMTWEIIQNPPKKTKMFLGSCPKLTVGTSENAM